MDNENEKDGKACCSKKCCGGKALAVLALLAVGATGGYVAGKCCAAKNATVTTAAPVQPAK